MNGDIESVEEVLNKGREKQLEAVKHGLLLNLGAVYALANIQGLAPKTVGRISHALFGVELHPKPGGFSARVPLASLGLYALPAPVGVNPPEVFGLHPNFTKQLFPFLPSDIPGVSGLLGTKPDPERIAAFELTQAIRRAEQNAALSRIIRGEEIPFTAPRPTRAEIETAAEELRQGLPPLSLNAPTVNADDLKAKIAKLVQEAEAKQRQDALRSEIALAAALLGVAYLQLLQSQLPPDP